MTNPSPAFLLAAAVCAAVACSALPDYAAPQGGIVDATSLDLSDLADYRTLARADFKAVDPPDSLAPHADRVFAATCGFILATPDTRLEVRTIQSADGTLAYRATPRHVRFRAQMDRNCSWWNPRDLGVPEEYVLEHEQIHFALFELEARRLNESIEEIQSGIDATAGSPDAAVRAAQQQLEDKIRKRMDAILERSREFDEDTSLGYKPDEQKRWWRLVQSELAETSP